MTGLQQRCRRNLRCLTLSACRMDWLEHGGNREIPLILVRYRNGPISFPSRSSPMILPQVPPCDLSIHAVFAPLRLTSWSILVTLTILVINLHR